MNTFCKSNTKNSRIFHTLNVIKQRDGYLSHKPSLKRKRQLNYNVVKFDTPKG